VSDTLHVTTSRDILESIARGEDRRGQHGARYAGWDAGQLEDEVRAELLADRALRREHRVLGAFEQRWNAAARLLGVDLSRISHLSGRA